MAYANRSGKIARFKIGYLQKEDILHQAKITEGTDASVYDSTKLGYLVGRVVKVTKGADGIYTIAQPTATDTEANILATGTHIIAQSDNTVRNTPDECIPAERYNTRYDGIVKNTTGADAKSIAVYKIVNKDDIEFIDL